MPLLRSLQCTQEGFAFDPENGTAYLLNATGRLAYEALVAGESISAVATLLAQKCLIETATAERDLRDFVERLASYEVFADAP